MKTTTVKSHKRKGRIVRQHARTVKKGKKWVSDAPDLYRKDAYRDKLRKKFLKKDKRSIIDKISDAEPYKVEPYSTTFSKEEKRIARREPDLYQKKSDRGTGNKALRRAGVTVTDTKANMGNRSFGEKQLLRLRRKDTNAKRLKELVSRSPAKS